jgi:hypothetical protein
MSEFEECRRREHQLFDACQQAVSDLVGADYDDGNHPVVERVISDLRDVIADTQDYN